MRYFYINGERQLVGPYSAAECRQLHLNGVLCAETEVQAEGAGAVVRFREIWPQLTESKPVLDASPNRKSLGMSYPSLASKTLADLVAMRSHLLFPLEEMRGLRWVENRRLLGILAIGLLPLVLVLAFVQQGDIRSAYWGIALYFSVVWALFFRQVFPAEDIRNADCVLSFFATAVAGIGVLLTLQQVAPWTWLYGQTKQENILMRLVGFTFGVGLAEEFCKAMVLFYLMRRIPAPAPHLLLFYGLMAGLGFGIREGIHYQTGQNAALDGQSQYLTNVLRLTTLPFLHAIWTGTAGYFLGFAARHPGRKHGLFVAAIGIPALLHGLYDTLAGSWLGIAVAAASVVALVLYRGRSLELERVLAECSGKTNVTQ